jgi:pyruvate ferredoxin oxidoreductase alpha subunit
VIVVAGSAAGTAKDAVDAMRKVGKNVGLLKIKMFRPFPHEEIVHLLQHVKNIAVLDRSMAQGTYPPIYSDIVIALHNFSDEKHNISSYVYGLGGRDISKEDIGKVFEDLEMQKNGGIIKYIK